MTEEGFNTAEPALSEEEEVEEEELVSMESFLLD